MVVNRWSLRDLSVLGLLLASALVLVSHLLYLYLADATRFPINTIRIVASYEHVSRSQLEHVLANYTDASFFSVSLNSLGEELRKHPWIDQVQIERIWPDALKIHLYEKIPVAVWNQALLTDKGEIFYQDLAKAAEKSLKQALPYLKGPENQAKHVLQVYKKMSKILTKYGLKAEALERRENQAWELTLSNEVKVRLGKRFLYTRIKRFCRAYPIIFADKYDQLASVDLRYPRGMAVEWKK